MNQLDQIPREDLLTMLLERAFNTNDDVMFEERQGYSFDVSSETAYRDILYRDAPLFATRQEALLEHWKSHYKNRKPQEEGNEE